MESEVFVPNIESLNIQLTDEAKKMFRVNNQIALCVTLKYIYLVDVTKKFMEFKIIKDFFNEKTLKY